MTAPEPDSRNPGATVPAAPAHAATVILLREAGPGGELEVLLTRRAAGLSFMGGLWVFPGGRLDPADLATARLHAFASPPTGVAAAAQPVTSSTSRMLDAQSGRPLPEELAVGLLVAACRETFEEAGVLLARDALRGLSPGAETLARMAGRRAASEKDASVFARLLEDEGLALDVRPLVYWSHWITPSAEKRRFDTRFFVVRVPDDQHSSVEPGELTQQAWLGEHDVRERLARGEMRMAPPTLATLEDLWRCRARHGGLEALLEAGRSRVVPPIQPKLVRTDAGGVEAVLPWDAGFDALPGEAGARVESWPDYLCALPSRRTLTLS